MPRVAGWDTAPRHQVGTSNAFSPSNQNWLNNHVTGRSQSQGDALALIRSANLKITRQLNSRAATLHNQVRPNFNNTQVRPNFNNTQVRPNFNNTQVRPNNTNFNSWKKPSSTLVSAKPHNGGFVYTNALSSQWPVSVEDDNLSAGSDSDSQGSIICVSDGPSTVRKHASSSHSHSNHRQGNHQPDMYATANRQHNFSNARQSSLDGAMDSHRPVTGGVWNPAPASQHRAETSGWSAAGQGQGQEVARPEEGEASLAPGDVRHMTAMWEKQGSGESGRDGRPHQRPFTASVHTAASGDRPSSAVPSIQAQFNAWKQSQAASDPWVKSGQPAKPKPGPASVYGQMSPTRTTFGPQTSPTRTGYNQGPPAKTNHGPQGSPTRTTFGSQASPTRSTFGNQASANRAGYASQGSPTRGSQGLSKAHFGPQTSYGPSQPSHGPSQNSYGPPQVSPKPAAKPGYGGKAGPGVSGYMSESGVGDWQDTPGRADYGWSSSSRALFSPPNVQRDYASSFGQSQESIGEEQAQYKSTATLLSKSTPAASAPATGTKLTVRPSSASSATSNNAGSTFNTGSWKPRSVQQPSDTNSLSWKPQSRPSQQLADFRKGVGSEDGEDKKTDTTVKGGVSEVADLGSRSSSNDTLSNLVAANRDDVSAGNNKRLMELIERARDTERELADGGDDSGRALSPLSHVPAADKLLSPTGKTSSWSGAVSNFSSTRSGMPQSQNPTMTLLQKNREGGLSKGAQYIDTVDAIESNKKQLEQFNVNSVSSTPIMPAASVLQDRGPLSITMTSMERARPHTAPASGRALHPNNTEGATLTSGKTLHPADPATLTSSRDDVTESSKDAERKPIKYVGIGPMDKETGMPVGLRMNVDDSLRHDWYRQMYKTLHHAPDKPGSKVDLEEMIKSADVSLKELSEILNMTPEEVKTKMIESDWTPASAKYRPQVYKNQPKSISDYEPGKSSLARNEHLQSELYNPPVHSPAQHSKYTDKKRDVTVHKTSQGGGGVGVGGDLHDIYKRMQKGEHDIPLSGLRGLTPERTHTPSGRRSSQPPDAVSPVPLMSAANEHSWGSLDRTKRDELSRQRHAEVERLIEREKRKKWDEEMKANEARRHNDFTLPQQKSPIPIDRFEDVVTSSHLPLPVNKGRIVVRGKASALYTFRAKGPRELSMRKGDVIYLLRDVDKNWYEAEHHGCVGIVPKSYVNVLTSIEQAHSSAGEREGHATAKFNFVPRTNAELPLKKGDVVKLVRRIDDNWYEGKLGHKQGIFPISYVEVGQEPRTPLTTPVPSCAPTPIFGSAGRLSPVGSVCSGAAPTIPSVPASPAPLDWDDLDPQKYMRPWLSQSVPSVSQASEKPHTFSNGLKATSQTLATPKAKYPVYKAMFRYEAQNADELCLMEGDVVQVVEKCEDGWYVGLSERTHDFGTFPGNYVQPVM